MAWRIPEGLKIAAALPVYQIANLVAYANTRQGWRAKASTIVVFLPILFLTTTLWAAAWTAVLWIGYSLLVQ
jgi:hypothetical protein